MSSFFGITFKNYSLGQAVRAEIEEDIGFLVRGLPGIVGFALRYMAYKLLFARIASMPIIYPGVRFVFMKNIRLGKSVSVNSGSYLYGRGGIDIGDNVLISPNCVIVAGDHDLHAAGLIMEHPTKSQKIIIESDSWIGGNAVILGGTTVAQGSVIGAGAVVTKDTEPYSINVGAPAKKIGVRGAPAKSKGA